jgi:hypothetical protein
MHLPWRTNATRPDRGGLRHRAGPGAARWTHLPYSTRSPRMLAAVMAEEFARIGRPKLIEEPAHRTYALLHA